MQGTEGLEWGWKGGKGGSKSVGGRGIERGQIQSFRGAEEKMEGGRKDGGRRERR